MRWVARLRAFLTRAPEVEVHDVWTRTVRELRREELQARQRRYLRTVLPALVLTMTGLLLPGPGWLRIGCLVVAGLLAPFALAATVPRRW